ncbi:MAG: hypothetical protein ACP6KW_03960 [Candidatus Thorarchaeota archaeon]
MVVESFSGKGIDLRSELTSLVTTRKLSSLSMLAQLTGHDVESVRAVISELVEEGALKGHFSDDGTRFFLMEVKVSEAPVVRTNEDFVIKEPDNRLWKLVFAVGVVMMIAGLVTRGYGYIDMFFENLGSGLLMIGLAVMAAGWLQVGRHTKSAIE